MQRETEASRGTIEWLMIARGLAILTIVFGHFDPELLPAWWIEIRSVNRTFQLPLFFILSGYLYTHGKYPYRILVERKARRLLYPFVSTALIYFLIKFAAGMVLKLRHPVSVHNVVALLIDPIHSFVPLLWFLHALFLIFVTYPLVRLALNNLFMLVSLILIVSVIGYDYPVFGLVLANMPFFVVGVLLRENEEFSRMAIKAQWRYAVTWSLVFLLAYTIKRFVIFDFVNAYPYRCLVAGVGSFFVFNLSYSISAISHSRTKSALVQIGCYTTSIYLFHTLFESPIRIAVFELTQIPFALIAFVAITCGVVFPLLLEKKVLRNNWVTKKFVLGLA